MEKILFALMFFATTANAQLFQSAYKVTKAKVAGWGITAVGGALDGMLEGYAFDGRKSFERKHGVSKYGYFGSESWRKLGYIGGSIILGIGGAKLNNKWWHYAADFTISFAISAATKSAGMYYIRK